MNYFSKSAVKMMMEQRFSELRGSLLEANRLTQAMLQIAKREGANTDWAGLQARLEEALQQQEQALNPRRDRI